MSPVNRLSTYASFVRFSHSVFALPFALTGALLAIYERELRGTAFDGSIWAHVAWIVVAMVAARRAPLGSVMIAV